MLKRNLLVFASLVLTLLLCLNFVGATLVEIKVNQDANYKDGHVDDVPTITSNGVAFKVGDDTGNYYRSFIDFNTSVIPDGSTINSVSLQLAASSFSAGITQVVGLNARSATYTAANLLTACASATSVYNSSFTFGSNNVPKNLSLNGAAVQNLSINLPNDFFSLCLYMPGDSGLLGVETDFHSNESATEAYRPRIFVDYTPLAVAVLNTTVIYPTTSDFNATQNKFFNVTVNVTCLNAACGNVNVSLDPAAVVQGAYVEVQKVELRTEPLGFFARIWNFFLGLFGGRGITGNVVGELVNTTTGALPFYTNMSNPANSSGFSCLNNMAGGSSCIVYWYVNATNQSGKFDFYAFANSTTTPSIASVESGHFNVTIKQEDLAYPIITTIRELDPYYVAPIAQEWNGTIEFSANVTDNIAVDSVWLNISNGTSPSYVYKMGFVGNNTYTIELNASVFAFGTRNFTIYANDTSNLLSNTSLKNFSVFDLRLPSIANVTIVPTYPNPSDNVNINATIYDDYAVSSAWVEIITPAGVSNNYTMSNISSSYGYAYSAVARGRYIVYIYANDSFGNIRSTRDIPRYFAVPPVVLTDKDLYAQQQIINITGFGFSSTQSIDIWIGTPTANLTVFTTTSSAGGLISATFAIPYNTAAGNYTVYASDPVFSVKVFKQIKIEGIMITYPAGSILIPGDDKQSPDAYDLDFLGMYGVVYKSLNLSHKLEWVITPDCVRFNATNIDTSMEYGEDFCHGFWLIKENLTDALSYINSVRGSVQILTLNEEARVPKAQISQLRRAPRIAVLSGSQGQINAVMTKADLPYALLSESQVMDSSVFNNAKYDILLVGDQDFSKSDPNLAKNISRFVSAGGYLHAEDHGAITFEAQSGLLGGLAEDGTYAGDVNVVAPPSSITQVQLSPFSNSFGSVSVLDVSGATAPYTVFLADANSPPSTNAKLIGFDSGKGYVTYSGGHIGSSQGSSALGRPRNRVLCNLIFFSLNVNDLDAPESWGLTPAPADNVTQFRAINVSAYVMDNVAVQSVSANISWDSTSGLFNLNGPDNLGRYAFEFTNTSYVIDKNTPTRYNVTFYANDSDGNKVNSSTYFNVIPDQLPKWSTNLSNVTATYDGSTPTVLNITWDDDYGLGTAYFEITSSGSSLNYSATSSSGNATCKNYSYSAVLAAGNYSWRSISFDDYNQMNVSMQWNFTINPAPDSGDGGSGGGGGDCTDASWTCSIWSECAEGAKTRTCTSNCDNVRTESEGCSNSTCIDECAVVGEYCSGNAVERCEFSGGCRKAIFVETCGEGYSCVGGGCVLEVIEEEIPQGDETVLGHHRTILGNYTWPSQWIPHGGIPDPMFDAGVITIAAGTMLWIFWIILLWIAGMLLPLFVLKLKHYIVSVFDGRNLLGVFENKKLDRNKLLWILEAIDKEFESIVLADKSEDVAKYLMKSGFLEVRLDEPFILVAHFTKKKHADRFEEVLRKILDRLAGKDKLKIFRKVEKASVIRAIRAYFRQRKTEMEVRKLFRR